MIKITYQAILDAGFTQHGNWYIRDNVSVNLLGQSILHTGKPKFCIEHPGDITLNDVLAFSKIMAKMTGGMDGENEINN